MSTPVVNSAEAVRKHRPYVPETMQMKEFTVGTVALGLVMTVVGLRAAFFSVVPTDRRAWKNWRMGQRPPCISWIHTAVTATRPSRSHVGSLRSGVRMSGRWREWLIGGMGCA